MDELVRGGYEEIRGPEKRKEVEAKLDEIESRGRYRERSWVKG